jgi:hypothetical protein
MFRIVAGSTKESIGSNHRVVHSHDATMPLPNNDPTSTTNARQAAVPRTIELIGIDRDFGG